MQRGGKSVFFMLEEKAGRWWQSTESSLLRSCQEHEDEDEDAPSFTWAGFKEILMTSTFQGVGRKKEFGNS